MLHIILFAANAVHFYTGNFWEKVLQTNEFHDTRNSLFSDLVTFGIVCYVTKMSYNSIYVERNDEKCPRTMRVEKIGKNAFC